MKKLLIVSLLLSLCLPVARANTPVKATLPMSIHEVANLPAQHGGALNARMAGGVLLIDYDEAMTLPATASLRFVLRDAQQRPLPGVDQKAYLRDVAASSLWEPSQEGRALQGDVVLDLAVDPTCHSLSLRIETETAFYQTAPLPVLWRPLPNYPTTHVAVSPGKDLRIGVGQTIALNIASLSATTDTRISLASVGFDTHLAFDAQALTVSGTSVGTQTLLVQNSAGQPLDTLRFTVQPQFAAQPIPSPAPTLPAHRVLPRKLPAYTRPDALSPRAGTLPANWPVHIASLQEGWALLDIGVWVDARYLGAL